MHILLLEIASNFSGTPWQLWFILSCRGVTGFTDLNNWWKIGDVTRAAFPLFLILNPKNKMIAGPVGPEGPKGDTGDTKKSGISFYNDEAEAILEEYLKQKV